jgi:putative hydrolase of the HAD superfamily
MRISTVLLDADGVVQFPGAIAAHFAQRYGWPEDKLRGFFHHVFHERPELDGGLTGDEDLRVVMHEALPEWGWAEEPDIFVRDWLRLGAVPDPAVLDLVARLRAAGVVCGLASNQPMLRARYMDDDLGYRKLFDHRFYSAELGYAKPDAEFFTAALAALGAPPSQVLFIDDREENVAAARACGLHGVVHRPGDLLHDQLARYALPA